MAGYTKLFNSILVSTIWSESNETRIIWITMLAMAEMDGCVNASIPGLAKVAGMSIEQTEAALAILSGPDKYSRTPDCEGRRIREKEGGGGWELINHEKYRDQLRNDTYGSAENRRGKIYFIKCDNLLKIGFSKNPWARFAALKTGMSGVVSLLGFIDGTLRDELELQKQFESSRFNREWYSFTPDIMAFLESKSIATVALPVATTKDGSKLVELHKAATTTKASTSTPNNIHVDFVNAWNAMGTPFSKIEHWNKKRQVAFKVRWADKYFREHWQEALSIMAKSDFHRGSGDRCWIANPEWFLRDGSVVGLIERKNQNGQSNLFSKPQAAGYRSPEQASDISKLMSRAIKIPSTDAPSNQ